MKHKITNYILYQHKFKLNKRQMSTAYSLKLFWFCFWQKRNQKDSWEDSGREQGSIVLHVRVAITSRHPFLSSASLANKLWQIVSCWNFQFILYVQNSFNLPVPLYSLFTTERQVIVSSSSRQPLCYVLSGALKAPWFGFWALNFWLHCSKWNASSLLWQL